MFYRYYFFFLTTTTATTATTTTTITIGTTGEDFLEVVEASEVVFASLDALVASADSATASGLSELNPETVNWI